MTDKNIVWSGMVVGVIGTLLAVGLILFDIQAKLGILLALLAGLGFSIGTGVEIYTTWPAYSHTSAPLWQTGLRLVFTLLGACFAPWLVIGLLALIF